MTTNYPTTPRGMDELHSPIQRSFRAFASSHANFLGFSKGTIMEIRRVLAPELPSWESARAC
jgi:hypothetical protein